MRGDVPFTVEDLTASVVFSPHARGCSYEPVPAVGDALVFPACAGMFPPGVDVNPGDVGFPRMRGDVPGPVPLINCDPMFSPHARGCSCGRRRRRREHAVFPACAGMFPSSMENKAGRKGFPRMRGDVPCLFLLGDRRGSVFPACAGMFRVSG